METIIKLHYKALEYEKLAKEMYWLSFTSKHSYREYHDAQIKFMKASLPLKCRHNDKLWIQSPMQLSKFYSAIAKGARKFRDKYIISKQTEIRSIYGGRSVC